MPTTSTLSRGQHPRVLFVGPDDGSPQIAAGLLRRSLGDSVAVATAGTQAADPGGRSDEMLVAMGLDPADQQRLSSRTLHTADLVVILGVGLDVARLPGPRYEEWDLVGDDLAQRVQALSDELSTASTVPPRPPLWRRLLARLRPSVPSR